MTFRPPVMRGVLMGAAALIAILLIGALRNSVAAQDDPVQVFLPAAGRDVGAPGSVPNTPTPTATVEPTATPLPTLAPPEPVATVLIPAGTFQMGCDSSVDAQCAEPVDDEFANEVPLHTVTLDAYAIDKYEVSNAHYYVCVSAGVCTPPASVNSHTRSPYFGHPDYATYPVIYVNWTQANTYCGWIGKRLPTEAEWERAARGDVDTRIYPWGNGAPTCVLSNFEVPCAGDTAAVGSYASGASPFGVMDMSGNVSEWVNDWYAEDYYAQSPAENPPGPATGELRVLRGGGWHFGAPYVRVTNRFRDYPNSTDAAPATGFRCAQDPQ